MLLDSKVIRGTSYIQGNGDALENKVSKNGYTIRGKHYKRIPRRYDDFHESAEFLLYNGLTAMYESEIPEELFSKSIIEYVVSHFKKMSPLHEWLRNVLG